MFPSRQLFFRQAKQLVGCRLGLPQQSFEQLDATDERTHLRVLTRLARLLRREGFIEQLRSTETPNEAYDLLTGAERELLDG